MGDEIQILIADDHPMMRKGLRLSIEPNAIQRRIEPAVPGWPARPDGDEKQINHLPRNRFDPDSVRVSVKPYRPQQKA